MLNRRNLIVSGLAGATAGLAGNTAFAQANPAAAKVATAEDASQNAGQNGGEAPKVWVDKETGHRITRLSTTPGMRALYFHQNGYTAEGDQLIVKGDKGIFAIDLKTGANRAIVARDDVVLLFTGRKTRRVFFTTKQPGGTDSVAEATPAKPLTIWTADVDTGAIKELVTVKRGSIASLSADETRLLGSYAEREFTLQPGAIGRDEKTGQSIFTALGPDGKPLSFADAKEVRMNTRLEERIPMTMFTIDVATGAVSTVHQATDWLNHLQFSPTDPDLIMFCHEGPWHKVDRIWTIRSDGSGLEKIHTRMMNMEIAGHEFFSSDGKTIWYDLQTPRGEDFWLAAHDIATKKKTWYHLLRDEWSVHFNISADGSLFAGDGGDEGMVAKAKNGKWIYAFQPQPIPDVAGIKAANSADLVSPGALKAEKLVDMRRHDYRLEPNITFTPDQKAIVFSSNMHGQNHVYRVELDRA